MARPGKDPLRFKEGDVLGRAQGGDEEALQALIADDCDLLDDQDDDPFFAAYPYLRLDE